MEVSINVFIRLYYVCTYMYVTILTLMSLIMFDNAWDNQSFHEEASVIEEIQGRRCWTGVDP